VSTPLTISYHLVAPPAERRKRTIYTVPHGGRAKIEEVEIYFPPGTYGELKVRLLYGAMKAWPGSDWTSGDNCAIRGRANVTYGPGEGVRLEYVNENDSQVRECFITLRGALE